MILFDYTPPTTVAQLETLLSEARTVLRDSPDQLSDLEAVMKIYRKELEDEGLV